MVSYRRVYAVEISFGSNGREIICGYSIGGYVNEQYAE